MSCTGTVLVAQAQALLRGAHLADPGANAIVREVTGSDSALHDSEGRLAFDAYAQLWHVASARSGDPDFGLTVAEQTLDESAFGVVGFAARSAPTLRDALDIAVRYSPVLNETSRTQLSDDGHVASVRDGPLDPTRPWPRHKAEYVMAAYVLLTRAWTGIEEDPLQVSFQHGAPAQLQTHHRIFGSAELCFGAAQNELRFPSRWQRLPLIQQEPRLQELLERRASDLAGALAQPEDLLATLRAAVVDLLPGGTPRIESAAASIGVGHRTLQRRLKEHGTSFRALVDDMRRDRSRVLLADSTLSIAEVATRLGFGEPTAFRRAHRRWTGLGPRQFRSGL